MHVRAHGLKLNSSRISRNLTLVKVRWKKPNLGGGFVQ